MALSQPEEKVNHKPDIPQTISILPLRNTVAFPFTIVPLSVGVVRSIKLVEDAVQGDHLIGLLTSKDPDEENPMPGQIYEVGTVARIRRMTRCSLDEERINLIIEGIERFKVLDWLLDVPWQVLSEDRLDINDARRVLDEDHYDLEEIKTRIIEFLAVRKLIRERDMQLSPEVATIADQAMGAALCFVGPPGVGKTSLGQSIARALARKFTRMSLGGMRDEAEIRGHRRTYVGAMPGRIIQAIKRAGTRNPVFMLDEVDKIGSDWRGDPGSALLEVLDPAQNHAFRDYYLDVDFDLSDVMFITTANQVETIPAPLRDRMETIALDGYTPYEKVHIADHFLVLRQLKVNGLRPEEIVFIAPSLQKIIQDYTREAGVRNLERLIGSICRKVAVKIAAEGITHQEITPERVRLYLKKEKFDAEQTEAAQIPGIAMVVAMASLFTGKPVEGDIGMTGEISMRGRLLPVGGN